jgi:hypothetical protein
MSWFRIPAPAKCPPRSSKPPDKDQGSRRPATADVPALSAVSLFSIRLWEGSGSLLALFSCAAAPRVSAGGRFPCPACLRRIGARNRAQVFTKKRWAGVCRPPHPPGIFTGKMMSPDFSRSVSERLAAARSCDRIHFTVQPGTAMTVKVMGLARLRLGQPLIFPRRIVPAPRGLGGNRQGKSRRTDSRAATKAFVALLNLGRAKYFESRDRRQGCQCRRPHERRE